MGDSRTCLDKFCSNSKRIGGRSKSVQCSEFLYGVESVPADVADRQHDCQKTYYGEIWRIYKAKSAHKVEKKGSDWFFLAIRIFIYAKNSRAKSRKGALNSIPYNSGVTKEQVEVQKL